MDLFLFRNEFFYFGVPIENPSQVAELRDFSLRPSKIDSTLWHFEYPQEGWEGFLLHFSNCVLKKKKSFHHEDKLFFPEREKTFAILFNGFLGKIPNFDLQSRKIEPYEFKSDVYNQFIRVFLKETIHYRKELIFLIYPHKIFPGYQHVLY